MRAARGRLLAAALSLGAAATAGAQDAPAIARWVPPAADPRHVFVLDSAHVLSAAAVRALQDSSRALQAETGADVVWVTLPSLGGRPIEEAALYVGRAWKVGNAGQAGDPTRNRGLVVLYVPDKRTTAGGANLRAEVGNGLEGTITDSRSRGITAAMRTDLKAKRYDAAFAAGFSAAALLVRESAADIRQPAPTPVPRIVTTTAKPSHLSPLVVTAIVVVLLVLLVWMIVRMARRRTPPGSPTIALERDDDANAGTGNDMAALAALLALSNRRRPSDDGGSGGSFDFGGGDSGGSGDSGGGDLGGGGGFSGGGSSDSV